MATTAELEDMVGYRLGFTISATSVPTATEVQSWLWEAAKKVAKKADPSFLEKLILTFTHTTDETLLLSSLTEYLRPLGLHIWYGVDADTLDQAQKAEYLSPNQFTKALRESSAFIKGTTEFPVYTISGSSVKWFPAYDAGTTDTGETHSQAWSRLSTNVGITNADVVLATGDYIRNEDEVCYVTSVAGNTALVVRGSCGTDKKDHPDDDDACLKIDSTLVDSAQVLTFEYITTPADAAGLDNQFDELLVDYATMMAKLQDEELADAQVFGQLFQAEFGGGAQ